MLSFQNAPISVVHLPTTETLNISAVIIYWFSFSYISVYIDNQLGFTQHALDKDAEQIWNIYEMRPQRLRGKYVSRNLLASLTMRDQDWLEIGLWGSHARITARFWQKSNQKEKLVPKDLITSGCGSAENSNNTWQKKKKTKKLPVWKYHSLQHFSLLSHLWMICANSLHRLLCKMSSALSHTCPGRGGPPTARHCMCVTFEVWSDASIVARCASHQFVQKVRWRGGLGRPAGDLHLLTEDRPARWQDNQLWMYWYFLLFFFHLNIQCLNFPHRKCLISFIFKIYNT